MVKMLSEVCSDMEIEPKRALLSSEELKTVLQSAA